MTSIVLVNFTADSMPEKPSSDWHESVLHKEVEKLANSEEIGGRFRDLWWTLGPYDVVIVVDDVPDHQRLAAFSLTLSKKFRAQTTTLPALATGEMESPMQICEIKDGL